MHFEVGGTQGLAVARFGHHDAAKPFLQVGQRRRQAKNRHHFRRHDDVKAVLPRVAIARPTKAHRDIAQRAVVHVHHALPGDAAHVNAQRVAVVDVVVDRRGQQIVGRGNGRKVAREVQVDVFHRHHLRIAATRRATLHAKHGAEARLAQRDHGFFADEVQRVAKADRSGGFALTRRRGADRSHQYQLAVGTVAQRGEVSQVDLGLGVAVRHEVRVGNAQAILRQVGDAAQRGALGDFNVTEWQGGLRWANRRG